MNEDRSERFYNKLNTVFSKPTAKDATVLLGDFNAKIGWVG